jgi:hypothetical protein
LCFSWGPNEEETMREVDKYGDYALCKAAIGFTGGWGVKKYMVRELDREHAIFIRRRGPCVLCGGATTECSHLFAGRRASTRWDVGPAGNCHPMCRFCHARHHNEGGGEYAGWFKRTHGEEAYDALLRRHNEIHRWTEDGMKALLRWLREQNSMEVVQ